MKISDYIKPSKRDIDLDISTSRINVSVDIDNVKEITMNSITTKKKSKVLKRSVCGIVCVALVSTMGIGVYAVSPEVQEFVDGIFQRNKQHVDNLYSQEEQTLMSNNLHIGDSSTSADEVSTFEDFDVSLTAVLNRGDSAQLIFTLDFSKNPEFLEKFKGNYYTLLLNADITPSTEDTPMFQEWSVGFNEIDFDNHTITYHVDFDDLNNGYMQFEEGISIKPTDMYNVTISGLTYGIYESLNEDEAKFTGLIEENTLEGEYSTSFCLGESSSNDSVDINKDIGWTYKSSDNSNYYSGTYDFTLNSVEYNNLEIKFDTTYEFIESESVMSNHIALARAFDTTESVKYFNGDDNYKDYIALRFIDKDGNEIIVPYTVSSSDENLTVVYADEDGSLITPYYTNDNAENVQLIFKLKTPVDFENIQSIEFCGVEIPIE